MAISPYRSRLFYREDRAGLANGLVMNIDSLSNNLLVFLLSSPTRVRRFFIDWSLGFLPQLSHRVRRFFTNILSTILWFSSSVPRWVRRFFIDWSRVHSQLLYGARKLFPISEARFFLLIERFFHPPTTLSKHYALSASHHQLYARRSSRPRRKAIVMTWHVIELRNTAYNLIRISWNCTHLSCATIFIESPNVISFPSYRPVSLTTSKNLKEVLRTSYVSYCRSSSSLAHKLTRKATYRPTPSESSGGSRRGVTSNTTKESHW